MKALASSRKPKRFGRIRQNDDSLEEAGIHKGDWVIVDLNRPPEQDELCAAFTAYGELVIRFFHEEVNGDICLTKGPRDPIIQVFAPGAVMIFGRVHKVVPDNLTQ